MIGKPPKELAEVSPLEREDAAEVIEGGLADAVRMADPEVMDRIVIIST